MAGLQGQYKKKRSIELGKKIRDFAKKNPEITRKELAEKFGVCYLTVKKHLEYNRLLDKKENGEN